MASDFYRFPGLPGKVLEHAQTKARAIAGSLRREQKARVPVPKLREASLSRYPVYGDEIAHRLVVGFA